MSNIEETVARATESAAQAREQLVPDEPEIDIVVCVKATVHVKIPFDKHHWAEGQTLGQIMSEVELMSDEDKFTMLVEHLQNTAEGDPSANIEIAVTTARRESDSPDQGEVLVAEGPKGGLN